MDRFPEPAWVSEKTFEDTMNWDDRRAIQMLELAQTHLQGALIPLPQKAKETLQDAWEDAAWLHIDYHFGPDRRDAALEYFNSTPAKKEEAV